MAFSNAQNVVSPVTTLLHSAPLCSTEIHWGLEPPRNVRRLSSNFVVEAFPRNLGGNGTNATRNATRNAVRPVAERNAERAEPMERQVTTEEVKDEEQWAERRCDEAEFVEFCGNLGLTFFIGILMPWFLNLISRGCLAFWGWFHYLFGDAMKIVFYFPRLPPPIGESFLADVFRIFVGRHVSYFSARTLTSWNHVALLRVAEIFWLSPSQSSLWGIIDRCVPRALRTKVHGDPCRFLAGRPRQRCQQETKVHHLFPPIDERMKYIIYIYIIILYIYMYNISEYTYNVTTHPQFDHKWWYILRILF